MSRRWSPSLLALMCLAAWSHSVAAGAGLAATMNEEEDCLAEEATVTMIQSSFNKIGDFGGKNVSHKKQPPVPSTAAMFPIRWLHVPKTGSSFFNSIVNLNGVCPGLPANTVVDSEQYGLRMLANFKNSGVDFESSCPGLNVTAGFGHHGLGRSADEYSAVAGRLMTFLRQPEQRLISAHNDMMRTVERGGSVNDPGASFAWHHDNVPSMSEWVSEAQGCSVKLITRTGLSCGSENPPTASEVSLAKQRLRDDFAFVGITDYWTLSICLFNRMFNSTCHDYQFANIRPSLYHQKEANESDSTPRASTLYDTRVLQNFTDTYDGELYSEGMDLFRARLVQYDVSYDSCAPCFEQAGLNLQDIESHLP